MFDRFVAFRARQTPHAVAVSLPTDDVSFADLDLAVGRVAAALAAEPRPALAAVRIADPYLRWLAVLAFARLGVASATVPSEADGALLPLLAPDLVLADGPDHALPRFRSRWLQATPEWQEAALRRTDPVVSPSRRDVDPDAAGRVVTSSGSTGIPKVIPLSWRVIDARVEQIALRYGSSPFLRRVLPVLDAGFGAFGRALAAWGTGGTLLITPRGAAELAGALTRLQPTGMLVSPIQLQRLLDALPPGFRPLPELRVDVSGSHVPLGLRRAARLRLTPELVVSYASSEAGFVAQGDAARLGDDEAACGWLFPWIEAEVTDDEGAALPPGQQGHIWLRGPGVAAGYRDDAEATAVHFQGGWYRSGDLGTLSAEGALRLEGRADDRMNFGGVKVLPRSMEEVALASAGVRDAAAFAVPNPAGGLDQPWLALVRDGEGDDAALGAALRQRCPSLPPVQVALVAAIPRNANGKIERSRLRDAVAARRR